MTNAYEIKQVLELVELIKQTVGINGLDAFKLLQDWTNNDSNKNDPNKVVMGKGEYVLTKNETQELLNSAKKAEKAIIKNWNDYVAKIESENPVKIKKEFDIKSIPLQILTKVDSQTTNKEIDSILSAIKTIEYIGFYKTSDEGKELQRIEKILEDRITDDMNEGNYKSLENSVRLIHRVKGNYRTVITGGVVSGGKIN